jgi:hypothetical protein
VAKEDAKPVAAQPAGDSQSRPAGKKEYDENLAVMELITRSKDPRKSVSIFAGTATQHEDPDIVVVDCPFCKTKISSSADKCYSCHNVQDKEKLRKLADEQKEINAQKKKEELKNKKKLMREQRAQPVSPAAPKPPPVRIQQEASPPPKPEIISIPAKEPAGAVAPVPEKEPSSSNIPVKPVAPPAKDELTDGLMKCSGCGTHISTTALRCYACGKLFGSEPVSAELPKPDDDAVMTQSIEPSPQPVRASKGGGVTVICDRGHITECDSGSIPQLCPTCGSRKLTFALGKLKVNKGGMFGKRTGVTQVGFKKGGRMEELDRQYGRR